jgi:hypothetical protein
VCETGRVLPKRGDYRRAKRGLPLSIASPWTAQDHIKAIDRKTGAGARSDLASFATGTGPN